MFKTSILENNVIKISSWVKLSEKKVVRAESEDIAVYHSLQQHDYVTIFAVRTDGLIPIVKQYRPAVEQFTIELPGGLIDRNVSPEIIAKNEVYEETGHKLISKLYPLGCLYPDTGRLENRLWAFFGKVSEDLSGDWSPEVGVEVLLVSKNELREMICNGSFNHALHLGLIGLALTKGLFSW